MGRAPGYRQAGSLQPFPTVSAVPKRLPGAPIRSLCDRGDPQTPTTIRPLSWIFYKKSERPVYPGYKKWGNGQWKTEQDMKWEWDTNWDQSGNGVVDLEQNKINNRVNIQGMGITVADSVYGQYV